jgi:hypothetical protein
MTMMRGLHEDVDQFELPRNAEPAQREAEQLIPQVRRSLIDDESRERQIQGEPNAGYF